MAKEIEKKMKRFKVTEIEWDNQEKVRATNIRCYVPFEQLPTEAEVLVEDVFCCENATEEEKEEDKNWLMEELESDLGYRYGWKVKKYTYIDIFGNGVPVRVTEPRFL